MNLPAPAPTITLRALGPSLGLLVSAILIVAAAIGWTYQLTQQVTLQHKQVQVRQSETRTRLTRVSEDERDIREKIARYRELDRRGLAQPEQRLHWVETLKSIKVSRRLLGLNYEIAPQRPLDPKQVASGGYDFLVSTMKLDLPMLHEGDLLGFVDDLSSQVQALIGIRACQIERVSPGTQGGANLKATCEIDWIKLQETR